MTFDDLPRWMRWWIVLAFVLIPVGAAVYVSMGVFEEIDSREAAWRYGLFANPARFRG